jgi:hypothetical protein
MTWQAAAIYGIAAVIAVQALLSLMTAHWKASLRRFLEEESRQREITSSQPTEPAPSGTGRTSPAA